jgi:hypothetical protein
MHDSEERHSDVDDVDIDSGVQKAVHDGPLAADELDDDRVGSGSEGVSGSHSDSTYIGTTKVDE